MKVGLQALLSDAHLDATQAQSQRQLSFSIGAIASDFQDATLPLNLCLVLDHSGSMAGQPLRTVKEAAIQLVDQLREGDRLSVIAFDHKAKVIVPNQDVTDKAHIKAQIDRLEAAGGTCIDDGIKLGLQELASSPGKRAAQVFMLTDGEMNMAIMAAAWKLPPLLPNMASPSIVSVLAKIGTRMSSKKLLMRPMAAWLILKPPIRPSPNLNDSSSAPNRLV